MGVSEKLQDVTPRMRWRAYAHRLIPLYFHDMWSYRKKVLDDMTPDAVHKMRVASRRLRAAMLDLKKCYPKAPFKIWHGKVGRLTEALGAVRDLDVLIQFFTAYQSNVPPHDREEIGTLIAHCQGRRARQRRRLRALLLRMGAQRFSAGFVRFFSR